MTGMVGGSVLLLTAPAQAVQYSLGEIRGTFDTTISAAMQWRVEERDPSNVGKANNVGDFAFSAASGGTVTPSTPGTFSVNSDDGNLNYDQWDPISSALKVSHELGAKWKNYGMFVRGFYFYDFTNANFEEDALSNFPTGDDRPQSVEDKVGYNAKLLDAYVYGDFLLGNNYLSIRAGRQVVSWGESTFIQNGINVINPIDVSKLRTAGSELKDALLPVPMVWASLDITLNTTVEAFYQIDYSNTVIDPRGTYFSTNDVVSISGNGIHLGSGLNDELVTLDCDTAIQCVMDVNEPDDSGQFGVALRWLIPELNSTELGFYYINRHSRLPLASWQVGGTTNPDTGATAPLAGGVFVEYPEDVKVAGVSFNTLLPTGTSLQGELSYTMDAPKQVDDVEMILAALANHPDPDTAAAAGLSQINAPDVQGVDPTTGYIKGYRRFDVWQLQFTGTHAFGPGWGASQRILLAEVGGQYVEDLPDRSVLAFNGPGTPRPSPWNSTDETLVPFGTGTGVGTEPPSQFADDFGWGYVLLTRLDYNNVIGAWNMSPQLAFAHDVNGTPPGPSTSFSEDTKSLTLALNMDYLSRWAVNLSYTSIYGAGSQNALRDRDFAGIEVKYSF